MVRFVISCLIFLCFWPTIGHTAAPERRSHLIELQLRDLARPSATAPTIAETPVPSDCGLCAEPSRLPSADHAALQRAAQEKQRREGLRRLHREILEQQSPHDAGHLIQQRLRDLQQSSDLATRPVTTLPAIPVRRDCGLCAQPAVLLSQEDHTLQPVAETTSVQPSPATAVARTAAPDNSAEQDSELRRGLHRLRREIPVQESAHAGNRFEE